LTLDPAINLACCIPCRFSLPIRTPGNGTPGSGRDLISVFISKEKGEELGRLVDNGTRIELEINVGNHNAFRYSNINRTSVLFVSVSFIILMIISLAWLIFYYVQRFRYIHAKDILAVRERERDTTDTVRNFSTETIYRIVKIACPDELPL